MTEMIDAARVPVAGSPNVAPMGSALPIAGPPETEVPFEPLPIPETGLPDLGGLPFPTGRAPSA